MCAVAWDPERPRARQGKKLPVTLRRKVIARDRRNNAGCWFLYMDICQGIGGIVQIHHLVEVEDGGTDDLDNLATACVPCHTRFSARQAQKRAVKAGNAWKRQPEKHPGVLD
jgi:5-methylcytosine-specific restriction endonuclease McrA